MKATTRRKLEMGQRALEFSQSHPDASPGYAAAVTSLTERLARAEQVAAQQRDGVLQVRAATGRKKELRQMMTQAQLHHLARVAEVAAQESPELPRKIALRLENNSYLAFRTVARGMAAEAQTQKELLVKYGLADTVFDGLTQSLDQFDTAVEEGTQGRRAHVGASAELGALANEIVQVVKVMDGLNRFRFAKDPESLAAWESASNVVATPRAAPVSKPEPGTPEGPVPAGGEVRPAA
jgi:hypothetical protein